MQPQHILTLKAAALARTSPMQWQDFLRSLEEYINVHKENLVNSPLSELPVNQGRAHSLSTLHKLLRESIVNSEKITKEK